MLDNGQAWLTTNKRDRDLLNTDADNVAKYMAYTPQPALLQPVMAPVSQELRVEEEAVSRLRVQLRMAEEAAALSRRGLPPPLQGWCSSIVDKERTLASRLRTWPRLSRAAPACSDLLLGRCPHRVAAEREARGDSPPSSSER